jgi:hypothetical protein
MSGATGVKIGKEPCAGAVTFAGVALAGALYVCVLLARRKSALIAHAEPADQLTRVRGPLRSRVASEFYERPIGHHIIGKSTVTGIVNESRLPVIVSAETHVARLFCWIELLLQAGPGL